MRAAQEMGLLTCPNDSLGNPRPPVTTTPGETWIVKGMKSKGRAGVTTRDFLGADLRHYIRALKNKGVGIRDEWETDSFGRHKRWFLKEGHSLEVIPKKTKAAGGKAKRLSNPIASNGEIGGLSDG